MSALIRLFSDLERLGPGSAESVRWALAVASVPKTGRILDAGCGTGADLRTLAAAVPQGEVVALDRQDAFIGRVRDRFAGIKALAGDFMQPPAGPFDLIWSAGAVYSVGVEAALRAWRDHLAEGGRVGFSDLRWRGADRPDQVRAFFETQDGITVMDVPALEAEIARAGYRILNARWLGAPGWASYYGPLEVALETFDGDPDLVARLRAEIALWRTHGVSYGCRIVVCEPVVQHDPSQH